MPTTFKEIVSQNDVLQSSQNQAISLDHSRSCSNLLIDVRSAKEFDQGKIDDAINIPLFDGYERGIIGTIYKHANQQEAIEKGFEFVEKKFPDLVKNFLPLKNKKLTVYCAKGGMRSRAIVNLLGCLGIEAYQLEGGYQQYRRDTIDYLENFDQKFIVLHGLTGTGKTRIIEKLDHAIDLEGLAQHRSSLFGGINLCPRTQKQFDSYLTDALQKQKHPPLFIEGESNKLGKVYIPKGVFQSMRNGIMVNITASIPTRIKRIIADYPITNEKIRQQMHNTLLALQKRLGKETVHTLCNHLRDNRLEELVAILLNEYYDKRYNNMYKRYTFVTNICSEEIDQAVEDLINLRKKYVNSYDGH